MKWQRCYSAGPSRIVLRESTLKESSVVVLEFNELTPHLIEQWMDEGKLPGFKQLHDESTIIVTDAEEPEASLEPWIQWVTVHSGLTFKEHGIYDLGDGHKLRAPRLWDVASEAGKRVWICGSMNAGVYGKSVNGAIIPDPWSTGFKPFPEKDFEHFCRYIQTSVQEYTRSDVPLTISDHLKFGWFMLRNGLSFETMKRTVKQLLSERTSGGKFHWRRAMILDRLMWDLFRSGWASLKPHYSTLFLNSTAHLQHYHWRNMDPDSFKLKPDAAEQAEYQDAVLRGYQAMDKIILEALQMIKGTNTNLVMMTALSQQPLTRYEDSGGKQLFKSRDPMEFLRFAGVTASAKYEPVMAEEFRYIFDTPEDAEQAQEKLLAIKVNDEAVIRCRQDGVELFLACAIISSPADSAEMKTADGNTSRFDAMFYPMLNVKSGSHHPDGMFWLRRPIAEHRKVASKLPLRRTTATLASLASLDPATIQKQFAYPGIEDLDLVGGTTKPTASELTTA